MSRTSLRQVLFSFIVALVGVGLFAGAHAVFADEVPESFPVGVDSSGRKSNAVPAEDLPSDVALPVTSYYDLDVEVLIKGSDRPAGPNRKKAWHIQTGIWRDIPFDLAVEADGQEFLVRGTLSQAKKGRLRLAITIRRAGSDWHRETKTTIEIVPNERLQFTRSSEERTFVTLRQREPGGLVSAHDSSQPGCSRARP